MTCILEVVSPFPPVQVAPGREVDWTLVWSHLVGIIRYLLCSRLTATTCGNVSPRGCLGLCGLDGGVVSTWKCSVVTFSMASFQKQLLCWIRIAALRQLWPAADLLSLVNRSPCAPRSEAPRLFTRAKSRFPAEHIFQNLATCICWAPALGGD